MLGFSCYLFFTSQPFYKKNQVKLLHNKQLKVLVYVWERKIKSVYGDTAIRKARPSLPRNLQSCAQRNGVM